MTGEQEPTGWELLRGIDRLGESINTVVQGMVTHAHLAVYQAAQAESDKRQNERITALESSAAEQRKTRQQQWFSIGLAAFVAVLALAGGVILWVIKGT